MQDVLERLAYCNGDAFAAFCLSYGLGEYTLKITHSGNYCHERSTDLNIEIEDELYEELGSENLKGLEDLIQADYIELCCELRDMGYTAIYASDEFGETLFEFNSDRLRVACKLEQDHDHPMDFDLFDCGDEEYDFENLMDFFNGKIAFGTFIVTIEVDGIEIDEQVFSSQFTPGKERKESFWAIREAIAGVREEILNALTNDHEVFA